MFNCNRVVFASAVQYILPHFRSYKRYQRKINTTHSSILRKKPQNPGMGKQLGFLKQETDTTSEPLEDFGDYEADFTQLHKVHRAHESEMVANKERLKYLIVRNKYFKSTEKQNFLTWAEKEQIRSLNKTDTEQWPIERLAESFPATVEIILKVIRGKWTPPNMKRIRQHDASVRETWKQFEAGELKDLHPEFVDHLKKFSHRSFDSSCSAYTAAANDQIQFQFPEPKTHEFSHIITSCGAMKKKSVKIECDENVKKPILISDQTSKEPILPPTTGDTYIYGKIVDKKYKKFDQLTCNKKPAPSSTKNAKQPQILQIRSSDETANAAIEDFQENSNEMINNNKLANVATEYTLPINHPVPQHSQQPQQTLSSVQRYATVKNPSGTGVVVDLNEKNQFDGERNIQKYNSRTVSIQPVESKYTIQIQEIQDRINIPRKLFKRGAVYKLYDCFYDDDGEFLYRVPGMVG